MDESFNPYHKWLAIPVSEQPAHHYRLLGIPLFEADPEVIECGADQRMAFVRTFQSGQNAELSQKILNEIAAAKVELLDPKTKSPYDEALRIKLSAKKAQGKAKLKTRSQSQGGSKPSAKAQRGKQAGAFNLDTKATTGVSRRTAPRKKKKSWALPATLLGAGGTLAIIVVIVLLSSGDDPPADDPPDESVEVVKFNDPAKDKKGDTKGTKDRPKDEGPKDTEKNDDPIKEPPPERIPPTPDPPISTGEPAEEVLAPALGKPVDLLAMVDVAKHRAKGDWRKVDGALESAAGQVAMLAVPYEPPTEYDLSLVVERTRGENALFIGLVADKRHFEVVLDAKPERKSTSGLDVVDGRRYVENETTTRGHVIEDGKPVAILCQVRRDRLVVKQGDTIVLDWQADYRRCGPYNEWSTGHPEWLAIGSYDSGFRFTKFECRPLAASAEDPTPPTPDPPLATKRPVPTAEQQQPVLARLEETFDFAKKRTPEEQIQLIDELTRLAQDPESEEHAPYVLLIKAVEMAAALDDLGLVFARADLIDRRYEIDVLKIKYGALKDIGKSVRGEEQIESLVRATEGLIGQAIVRNRVDVAVEAVKLSHAATLKGASRELRKEVLLKQREIRELHERWQLFQSAQKKLEEDTDDAEANRVVGSWHALERGSWETGLPLLVQGDDANLKKAAELDLAARDGDAKGRLAAADAWWQLAGEEKSPQANAMRLHAAEYYRPVLPNASSVLVKVRIEKRLGEAKEIEPPLGHNAVDPADTLVTSVGASGNPANTTFAEGKWVELLPLVEPRRQAVSGNWGRSGQGVFCKRVNNAILVIPVEVTGSYDVQFEFTRLAGDDSVNLFMPVGEQMSHLVLSGWHGECHGLERFDGRAARDNESAHRPGTLINGQKYKVDLQVRVEGEEGSIKVLLDDTPLTQWKGNVRSLSIEQRWHGFTNHRLVLRGWNVLAHFHRVALRLVDGQARPLGPEDPDGRKDFLSTKTAGGKGGRPFRELAPDGYYAIGLRASVENPSFAPMLRGFQLIYSNGKEEHQGSWYGTRGGTMEARAKEGYAIGGMISEPTGLMRGVKLQFMRIKGNALDPHDTYESEWLGTGGNEVQHFLGRPGTRVIGVTGRHGGAIDALGLLTSVSADPPQFQVDKFSTPDGLELLGWPEHVQTPVIYDGSTPITIETIVTPQRVNYRRHDTTVIGNLQGSGVGIAIDQGYWSLFWHGPSKFRKAMSDRPVEVNKTVHVAGVYDGRQLRLYVDGRLQGNVINVTGVKHQVSKHRYMIGADPDPADKPEHPFVGIIHRAHIASAALYTTPFSIKGDLRPDRRSSVLLYNFDEVTGTKVNDQSNGKRHGVLFGGVWLGNR